jgi:hypothetical protein
LSLNALIARRNVTELITNEGGADDRGFGGGGIDRAEGFERGDSVANAGPDVLGVGGGSRLNGRIQAGACSTKAESRTEKGAGKMPAVRNSTARAKSRRDARVTLQVVEKQRGWWITARVWRGVF